MKKDILNTPSPEAEGEVQRKKGLARLVQVVDRDFFSFFKAGALALLSAAPFIGGVVFAVRTAAMAPLLAAGVLGGMLAAPQVVGLLDTIARSLREEVGYWWGTYRTAWRRNARTSLLPGAFFGTLLAAQLFSLCLMTTGLLAKALTVLALAVTAGLAAYVFAQVALIELPLPGMLRNAALLFLGDLTASARACAVLAGWAGAVWLLYPLSLIFVLLTNLWAPALLTMMALYSTLDRALQIESRVLAQQGNARAGRD